MTLAADEAQGMPMAHNYDIFDGHAYLQRMCLICSNTMEIFFFLLFFWLKMLSQVVFAGQHGIGLHSFQPHFPYPNSKLRTRGGCILRNVLYVFHCK